MGLEGKGGGEKVTFWLTVLALALVSLAVASLGASEWRRKKKREGGEKRGVQSS